jgi:DtxR family Mn-dependent transcriptional regulator
MEHAMSPLMEEKMLAAIGNAKTCPHGHPIDPADRIAGVPLADCEVGAKITILRFENEAEDLLHYLKATGVEPGQKGEIVSVDDDEVTYRSDDGEHTLSLSSGETVSVLANPSPPPRTALPEQLVLAKERYGR